MAKIRIVLADDHTLVREGLKRLIEAEPDMEIVGEASEGSQAAVLALDLMPEVVVMDVAMPGVGGVEATRQLQLSAPGIRVLALTVHEDRTYVRELLDAGAAGYLVKRAAAEDLIRAVRIVASGGTYLDPLVAGKFLTTKKTPASSPERGEITVREAAVLRRIAQGYANKEIAGELDLSVKTVETYKARAMEKLGLRSRVDIVRLGAERGWFQ